MTPQQQEEYANQDWVPMTDKPISDYGEGSRGRVLYENMTLNFFKEYASYFSESEVNFECLSEFQNKCLAMYYFDGLTYSEIAKEMDTYPGLVGWHLYRAKQILANKFATNRDQ